MKLIFSLICFCVLANMQTQAAALSDEHLACLSLHEAAQKGVLNEEDRIAFQKCIASNLVEFAGLDPLKQDGNRPGLAGGASAEVRNIANPIGLF